MQLGVRPSHVVETDTVEFGFFIKRQVLEASSPLMVRHEQAKGDHMSMTKHGGIVAGCLVCCLAATLWLSVPAAAGCISQTVGTTTVHNCDGKIGVSQTVGGTTVHSFDGKIGVSQTVGGATVHNFDGRLGTSQTVGMTTVHTIDGKSGMSQRVGTIVIHSGPLFDGY